MGQSRPDHALVLRDFAGYGLQMYDDEEWIHEHLMHGRISDTADRLLQLWGGKRALSVLEDGAGVREMGFFSASVWRPRSLTRRPLHCRYKLWPHGSNRWQLRAPFSTTSKEVCATSSARARRFALGPLGAFVSSLCPRRVSSRSSWCLVSTPASIFCVGILPGRTPP